MSEEILSQLEKADSQTQKTWIITSSLLQSISRPLAEVTLAAAIPHWFDQSVLTALVKKEPGGEKNLYRDLKSLSLVEPFGTIGYALHDLTRISILLHLIKNQDDRFLKYSQRAYDWTLAIWSFKGRGKRQR
jgi:hypothetical protein